MNAKTSKTKKSEAQKLADKILASKGGGTESIDGCHGRALEQALRDAGAKDHKSHSTCTKASFEACLKLPDGRRVDIIQSSFLGDFTQAEVRSNG